MQILSSNIGQLSCDLELWIISSAEYGLLHDALQKFFPTEHTNLLPDINQLSSPFNECLLDSLSLANT